MREIEFRAKRKLNSDWVYGSLYKDEQEDWDHIILLGEGGFADSEAYRVITRTVCQFTGLKDKNGNKIFEGDILKRDYGNNDFVIIEVEYMTFLRNVTNAQLQLSEIIGNIFEHPDLLK